MPTLREALSEDGDPLSRAEKFHSVAAWYDKRAGAADSRQDREHLREVAGALRDLAALVLRRGALVDVEALAEDSTESRRTAIVERVDRARERLADDRRDFRERADGLMAEAIDQETPVLGVTPRHDIRATSYQRFVDSTYEQFAGAGSRDERALKNATLRDWKQLTADFRVVGRRAVWTSARLDRDRNTGATRTDPGAGPEPEGPGVPERVMHAAAFAGALRAAAAAHEEVNGRFSEQQLLDRAFVLEQYARQELRRGGLEAGEARTREMVDTYARGYVADQPRLSQRRRDEQLAAFQARADDHYEHQRQELDTPDARNIDTRATAILRELGVPGEKLKHTNEHASAAFGWMTGVDSRDRAAQIAGFRRDSREESAAARAEFVQATLDYAERYKAGYAERVSVFTRPPDDGARGREGGEERDARVDSSTEAGSGQRDGGRAGPRPRTATAGFGPVGADTEQSDARGTGVGSSTSDAGTSAQQRGAHVPGGRAASPGNSGGIRGTTSADHGSRPQGREGGHFGRDPGNFAG